MRKLIFLLTLGLLQSCAQIGTVGDFLTIETPKNPKANFHPIWIKNLDPVYETGNLPIALNYP